MISFVVAEREACLLQPRAELRSITLYALWPHEGCLPTALQFRALPPG
jgi:hypothetical protein